MIFKKIDLEIQKFAPYVPVWTGHSQTLLGHLMPYRKDRAAYQKEILNLPDGDQLLLEWLAGTKAYTLIVMHGLGGNSNSDYMQRSSLIAQEVGWNVIRVNHRGASFEAKAVQSYHSGRGEDVDAVLGWSRSKFTGSKQVALGFSMSGSILLNLLTKRFGKAQPDFGIVVNAPLDLTNASFKLTKGFNRVYDFRFYLILKKIILKRSELRLPLLGRTMDIDRVYTAPVNQFSSREDFYESVSTKAFVQNIETKTFVLMSEDDPFIDVGDYLEAKWNDNVHMTINRHGGHMGYFSKEIDPKYGRRWLDLYLGSVLRKIQTI